MINPVLQKLLTELHARCGLCNHCGKRDCEGRQSGSKLPPMLDIHSVLSALAAADNALYATTTESGNNEQ